MTPFVIAIISALATAVIYCASKNSDAKGLALGAYTAAMVWVIYCLMHL